LPLTESQIQRYSRHILLPDIGGTGQARLLAARARLSIGEASGAQVAALAYLAAAGVGTLIVAGDVREPVTGRDVQLGILYGQSDIGRPRLDALRDRIGAINPDVEVTDAGSGHWLEIGPSTSETADVAGALIAGGEAALRFIAEVAR
jgi:adenylyltransferase/sulfurtransferase